MLADTNQSPPNSCRSHTRIDMDKCVGDKAREWWALHTRKSVNAE